jgi:hypothetical protein
MKILASALRAVAAFGLVILWSPTVSVAQNPEYCQPAPTEGCTMCSSDDCDYVACGANWCMVCDIEGVGRAVVGNYCEGW